MDALRKNTPERNQEFELDLNFITVNESIMNRADFETYAEYAYLFLRNSKMVMTEEDIEKRYNTKDINNVISSSPFFRETVPSRKQDGTPTKRYVDIAESYLVQPEDSSYDAFFAYKLRQISLLEIDNFLEYHLYFYYNNDIARYSRFLKLCIRTHEGKLTSETIITVSEWIEDKIIQDNRIKQIEQEKQQQALLDTKASQSEIEQELKIKGKHPKREAFDNKTCLTQEQTVLLLHYLQEKKVIFRDEYLTNKNAGIAFELLTGYSQNTLRQDLSKINDYKSKPNLKAVDNALTAMKLALDKDLKESKF